jgi:mono/diheme cytochrome c family protein
MKNLLVVSTVTLASSVAFALAQQAPGVGDAVKGHTYALAACASCHAIEKSGGPSPNTNAPAWLDVANTPGMTGTALTVFLSTPHKQMPDFVIPPANFADIVAYILSLKPLPPV